MEPQQPGIGWGFGVMGSQVGTPTPMFHRYHMRKFQALILCNSRHMPCSLPGHHKPTLSGQSPMTNQKLLMFAVAGALVPAADAAADIHAGKTTMFIPHPTVDKAPVTGTPARLRRTDSEQAGIEDTSFALFADGKSGLAFGLSTELPALTPGGPVRSAPNRVQGSVVPFSLVQNADGSVEAKPDLSKSRFITNNNGDEWRNAHAGATFTLASGTEICHEYNYQPNGGGDTQLYIQCFDQSGATLLGQTLAFAKNNDDAAMAEAKEALISSKNGVERYVRYYGANGNGRDDGWAGVFQIAHTANGLTYKREFDVSVIANEERSRGNCFIGTDKTVAICAATAGNTQPQRDGTYLIAVDVTEGKFQGANQQAALLWKKQIGGRATVNGVTTYSMRAMIEPVLTTDNKITDTYFWRAGATQGNNNDNRKGGQYVENMVGVVKATRDGVQFLTKPTGIAYTAGLGLDGTHLNMLGVLVGSGADLKPAILFQGSSHNGGNADSTLRAVGWDATAGFTNLGTYSAAPHDRHLYPNYLGNNPGNQGRDHSASQMIANPYFGQQGNNDKYLVLYSTSGKGANMDPAVKLASYMTVMPVASGAPATTQQTTGSSGSTGSTDTGNTASTDDSGSDTTLGGCSTAGSGGLETFLLIGLAAFIRRRR